MYPSRLSISSPYLNTPHRHATHLHVLLNCQIASCFLRSTPRNQEWVYHNLAITNLIILFTTVTTVHQFTKKKHFGNDIITHTTTLIASTHIVKSPVPTNPVSNPQIKMGLCFSSPSPSRSPNRSRSNRSSNSRRESHYNKYTSRPMTQTRPLRPFDPFPEIQSYRPNFDGSPPCPLGGRECQGKGGCQGHPGHALQPRQRAYDNRGRYLEDMPRRGEGRKSVKFSGERRRRVAK
ncbi:hypothetical protein E2P81_ATG02167 [Venturia nashicola]|nr:hypothetical protein E2P81_ATG02167 [Venturia nashicola]